MAEDLDYVPMPSNVVADIEKTWVAEIKGCGWQVGLDEI